jgi:hypothetical protein
MRKSIVLACILLILMPAFVLVGCGGGSSAQTPTQVSQAFWDAAIKKDANTTWNMMSAQAQKLMKTKSAWEAALKTATMPTKITAGKATINGDKATVKLTGTIGGKSQTTSVPLVKENGVWKMEPTQ